MRTLNFALALVAFVGAPPLHAFPSRHERVPAANAAPLHFEISFPASTHNEPITGRVFLAISRDSAPPPAGRGPP